MTGRTAEFTDHVPMFWARGSAIIRPHPYARGRLTADFSEVRKLAFGPNEKRQLRDMRRSGTVEAFAGGARPEQVSEKMAR